MASLGASSSPPPAPRLLVDASSLPAGATRYAYVLRHYRNPAHAAHATPLLLAASSLGSLHNETLNVASHLFPGLAAVLVLLPHLLARPGLAQASLEARLAPVLSCGGSAGMLLASAAAHALHPLSPRAAEFLWRVDLLAIMVNLLCRQYQDCYLLVGVHDLRSFYALQLGACLLVAALFREVMKGRFILSNIMGVYACVPMLGLLIVEAHGAGAEAAAARGVDVAALRAAVEGLGLCTFFAVFGNSLYWAQLPDRVFPPGSLDLVGNSHHILHITSAIACYHGAVASQHIPAYEASVWRAAGVAGPRGLWR